MIRKLQSLFDYRSLTVNLNSESTLCFLLSNAFCVLNSLPRNILPWQCLTVLYMRMDPSCCPRTPGYSVSTE